MEKKLWGTLDGKDVELFSLDLGQGCRAEITNFGAAVVSLFTPDKNGQLADVVLGYDSLEGYKKCSKSLGVIVGRHANRIQGAQFTLGDQTYKLTANVGNNHLHGGPGGFGRLVWDPEIIEVDNKKALKLKLFSPHGDEGYPGNLHVEVIYSGTGSGGLQMDYWARGDQDTVVNLTNHAYFNLAGQGTGLILDHELRLNADFFTPMNNESLTTGEIRKVEGTPLDFRTKKLIGDGIEAQHEQISFGSGYDFNWVLNRKGAGLEKAARVEHGPTGRVLEVLTTKPGIQFYSGNFLDDVGKGGALYPKWSGFCLETQFFPNSLRYSHFPSPVLKAGDVYKHSTIYQFSTLG